MKLLILPLMLIGCFLREHYSSSISDCTPLHLSGTSSWITERTSYMAWVFRRGSCAAKAEWRVINWRIYTSLGRGNYLLTMSMDTWIASVVTEPKKICALGPDRRCSDCVIEMAWRTVNKIRWSAFVVLCLRARVMYTCCPHNFWRLLYFDLVLILFWAVGEERISTVLFNLFNWVAW